MRILAWPGFVNVNENPYNFLLYRRIQQLGHEVADFNLWRLLVGNFDVWHMHWPERYLALRPITKAIGKTIVLLAAMSIARLRGIGIVWTIHNLNSHERRYPRLETLFWSLFVPRVDVAISLSDSARLLAQERFALAIPHRVIPHGDFRDAYPAPIARDVARRRLGLSRDEFVFLYLGKVRPYKGLDALVASFQDAEMENSRLMIAGAPMNESIGSQLLKAAARSTDILTDLRHIPSDEVPLFFGAANVVVLPYTDILNSGAALLALSFGRPVVVSNKGSIPELAATFGPYWVRPIADEISPEILREAARWPSTTGPELLPDALKTLSWTSIAQQTTESYAEALAMRRSSGAARDSADPLVDGHTQRNADRQIHRDRIDSIQPL